MGYKNNDRCLDKVEDDEPIFVLRSKDKLSPVMVRHWADLVEKLGSAPDKVHEARDLALRMEIYAEEKFSGGKIPD